MILRFLALLVACQIAAAAADIPAPRTFDFSQLKATDVFTAERGYGFDLGTAPSAQAPRPFYFSVAVPEGTYRVTVIFGDAAQPSETTLRAESRQLLLERLATAAGQFETRTFLVNVRTPAPSPAAEERAGRVRGAPQPARGRRCCAGTTN